MPALTQRTPYEMGAFWIDFEASMSTVLGEVNTAPMKASVLLQWLRQGTTNTTFSQAWQAIKDTTRTGYPPEAKWTDNDLARFKLQFESSLPIAQPALESVLQQFATAVIPDEPSKFVDTVVKMRDQIGMLYTRIWPEGEQTDKWARLVSKLFITCAIARNQRVWRTAGRVMKKPSHKTNGIIDTFDNKLLASIQNELMHDLAAERHAKRGHAAEVQAVDSGKRAKSNMPPLRTPHPRQGGGKGPLQDRQKSKPGPKDRPTHMCTHHGPNWSHNSEACRNLHPPSAEATSASAPTSADAPSTPLTRNPYMGAGRGRGRGGFSPRSFPSPPPGGPSVQGGAPPRGAPHQGASSNPSIQPKN